MKLLNQPIVWIRQLRSHTVKNSMRIVFASLMALTLPSAAHAGFFDDITKIVNKAVDKAVAIAFDAALKAAAGPIDQLTDRIQEFNENHKFYTWNVVTLPPEKDEFGNVPSCGNGTPYRFFVNRAAFSTDMVFYYEPGGVCVDNKSCVGAPGAPPAVNPNGVPENYLWKTVTALGAHLTPFTDRLRIRENTRVRTAEWDMVYFPYCTGDAHMGSNTKTYDAEGSLKARTQHFQGLANVRAATNWVKNNMNRPHNLLLTGTSAGSNGSAGTYPIVREILQPTGRGSLIADSGVHYPSPRNGSETDYPFLAKSRQIFEEWGVQKKGGIAAYYDNYPAKLGYDSNDPATIFRANANRYPNDHFSFIHFNMDETLANYSYYSVYPELINDPAKRMAYLHKDLNNFKAAMDTLPNKNVSYYMPHYRNFAGSHCATLIDFSGTGIQELNIPSVKTLIDHTLDGKPTAMRVRETDTEADYHQSYSRFFNAIVWAYSLF
jgi:hypothetical protein